MKEEHYKALAIYLALVSFVLSILPFVLVFLVLIFFTAIIAGSYPAFYLSGFLPGSILKNQISCVKKKNIIAKHTGHFSVFNFNFANHLYNIGK